MSTVLTSARRTALGIAVFAAGACAAPLSSLAASGDLVITPSSATYEATSSAGAVATFTAIDANGFSVVCDHASGSTFAEGITTVSCTATDPDHPTNIDSATATITVTPDVTPPVVTVASFTYVNAAAQAAALFSGTCESGLSVSLSVGTAALSGISCSAGTWSTSIDLSAIGDGFITATATQTDDAGNVGTGSANGKKDTVRPQIVVTGANPLTITQDSTYVDPGVYASEAIQGSVTADTTSLNVDVPGTYTVAYSATDLAGNTSLPDPSYQRTVIVQDITAPVITVLGASTYYTGVGQTYTDAGATATDNVDGSVTVASDIATSLNTNVAGIYTITYTATDSAGNSATATRTVRVIAPPTISAVVRTGASPTNAANAEFTITFSEPVLGVTSANFLVATTGTLTGTSIQSVSTGDHQNYTVSLSTGSGDGALSLSLSQNLSSITDQSHATVQLLAGTTTSSYSVDRTAPVITLAGLATTTISQFSDYHDAGATATDAVDGTVSVSVNNPVNTLVSDTTTYTVTYTATDSAGNTATSTRAVVVEPLPIVHSGGGGAGGGGSSSGGGSSQASVATAGGSVVVSQGGQVLGASTYNFTHDLKVGMKGDDVTALQQFLIDNGFMTGTTSGYFGSLTKAAVMKYQAAIGIESSGYVGAITRGKLNQGIIPTKKDEDKQLLIQKIIAQLKVLIALYEQQKAQGL